MRTPVAIALCALTLPAFATAEGGPGGIVENVLFAVDRYAGALVEHDDAGTGADAGNSPDLATPIETGRFVYGRTGPRAADPEDWFSFTVPPNSFVSGFLCGIYGADSLFLDEEGAAHGPSWYYNWCARLAGTSVAGGEWRFRIADIPDEEYDSVQYLASALLTDTRNYGFAISITRFAHGAELAVEDATSFGLTVGFPGTAFGEIVSSGASGDGAFVLRRAYRSGPHCYDGVAAGFDDALGSSVLAGGGALGAGASVALPVEPTAASFPLGPWAPWLSGGVQEVDLVASHPRSFRVNLLWNGNATTIGALRETTATAATFARLSDLVDGGPAAALGPVGLAKSAEIRFDLPPGRALGLAVDARHEPSALARWTTTNDVPEDAFRVVHPGGTIEIRDSMFASGFGTPGEHRVVVPQWADVEDGRIRVAAATFPAYCAA